MKLTQTERAAIFSKVQPVVDANSQGYIRVIGVALRRGIQTAEALQSYLSHPGNAVVDEHGELKYYIPKENTVWGAPCVYQMSLDCEGHLKICFPVSAHALRWSFKTDDFRKLELHADAACKMITNGNDLVNIGYSATTREFIYTFKGE